MSLTDTLLGKKKPAGGPKGPRGPKGPSGPKKGPKASPNQTTETTRKRTKKTLRNGPGKGPNKPPKKPTGGGKGPAQKTPETTPSANKGFGCFMNQIKNSPILRKQFSDLTIAIKIIETFLEEDSNPAALEVMGIEREEIVVLLQEVLGEYNDTFKKKANIGRIGELLRKAGHPGKFLFEEVFQLTENHDEGAIAVELKGFEDLVSQKKFFQIQDAMLNAYKEVLKTIEEKGVTDPKEREIIARNVLKMYRGYSLKLDLSDGRSAPAPAPAPAPTPVVAPAQPAAPAPAPTPAAPAPAPQPTAPILSAEEEGDIKKKARARVQAELQAEREAEEEKARKIAEEQEAERVRLVAMAKANQEAAEKAQREAEEARSKAAEAAKAEQPQEVNTTVIRDEVFEEELKAIKENMEINATHSPNVLSLYDLCEQISQLKADSLLGEQLLKSEKGGYLFEYFLELEEFDPGDIEEHLLRVLLAGGKELTSEMVLDELEALYELAYPEFTRLQKRADEEAHVIAGEKIKELEAEKKAEEERARKEAEEQAKQQAEEEKARREANETARKQAEEAAQQEAENEERARIEAEEQAKQEVLEQARLEAEAKARLEEGARIKAEEEARAEAEAKVAEAAGIASAAGGPQAMPAPTPPPPLATPTATPQSPTMTPVPPSASPIPVPPSASPAPPPAKPPKPLTKAEKMLADIAEAIDKSNIKCAYLLDLANTLIRIENPSLRDRLLALNHPFIERFLNENYKFNDSNFMNHLMVAVNKSVKRGKFVNAETINQHLSDIYDELGPLLESFQEEIRKEVQGEEAEMASDEDVVDLDPDEVDLDPEAVDTVVEPSRD